MELRGLTTPIKTFLGKNLPFSYEKVNVVGEFMVSVNQCACQNQYERNLDKRRSTGMN